MIRYILDILIFQLVFLLAYDLFLKKETFFQWNRFYLLCTFVLSLVLPWVKLEFLSTGMPQALGDVTIFFTQLDEVAVGPGSGEPSFWASLPWYYWPLALGSILAGLWFVVKLAQIGRLKQGGKVERFPGFVKITVPNSNLAFSFFRNIFLGEDIQRVPEREEQVIAHELVHVKQRHSLDLIFFELARIPFWFNPLVYLYQNRMAELHEFIADARMVKEDKREHFEMLLSEAFHTRNISFVNQFFNGSMIKKRIVMLQKNRSKAVWQLKYVLMLPLVLGMLVYTSCESEKGASIGNGPEASMDESIKISTDGEYVTYTLQVGDLDALTPREENLRSELLDTISKTVDLGAIEILDESQRSIRLEIEKGEIQRINVDKNIGKAKSASIDYLGRDKPVPFDQLDEVPVFPGCGDAQDKRECFQEKMQQHIMKNFRYPEQAQAQNIQGRVSILMIIGNDGNISDVRMRGPHELLEAEARRIIEKLPRMEPAKHGGEAVAVAFAIPITFKLQYKKEEGQDTQSKATGEMQVIGQRYAKDNVSYFRGKVTDGSDLALPGVTISIEGKDAGVVSDFDGQFVIQGKPEDVLKFEYIGLPTRTMVIPGHPYSRK